MQIATSAEVPHYQFANWFIIGIVTSSRTTRALSNSTSPHIISLASHQYTPSLIIEGSKQSHSSIDRMFQVGH